MRQTIVGLSALVVVGALVAGAVLLFGSTSTEWDANVVGVTAKNPATVTVEVVAMNVGDETAGGRCTVLMGDGAYKGSEVVTVPEQAPGDLYRVTLDVTIESEGAAFVDSGRVTCE